MDNYEASRFTYELDNLHRAGKTIRMHNLPTIEGSRVGDHSYGAAIIAHRLGKLNGVKDPERLALYMLFHDVAEIEVGDIPAPTKYSLGSTALTEIHKMEREVEVDFGVPTIELTPDEHFICKAADYAELGFTCLYERRLGNKHPRLARCFEKAISYYQGFTYVVGVKEIIAYLRSEWSRCNLGV